jgi:hypothetical protein
MVTSLNPTPFLIPNRTQSLKNLEARQSSIININNNNNGIENRPESRISDSSLDSSIRSINSDTSQRKNVINELISTEVAYCNDLKIIEKHYLLPCLENSHIFAEKDIKLVFYNLKEIIECSKTLQNSFNENDFMVGHSFMDNLELIRKVYLEYFKAHELSMQRLQELYQNTDVKNFFQVIIS